MALWFLSTTESWSCLKLLLPSIYLQICHAYIHWRCFLQKWRSTYCLESYCRVEVSSSELSLKPLNAAPAPSSFLGKLIASVAGGLRLWCRPRCVHQLSEDLSLFFPRILPSFEGDGFFLVVKCHPTIILLTFLSFPDFRKGDHL